MELKGVIPLTDIKTTINKGEIGEYVYIAIKSKDSADGMGKIHSAKTLYAPIDKHKVMVREIPRYKGLWNGMFNKIVILHDPTLPMAKEESKKISNQDKGKIKSMVKDGISVEDIAKELALDLDKVEEYSSKL